MLQRSNWNQKFIGHEGVTYVKSVALKITKKLDSFRYFEQIFKFLAKC